MDHLDENEYSSLFKYCSLLQQENASKETDQRSLIICEKGKTYDSNNKDFFWCYSTAFMKHIAISNTEWNLDATYQIMSCKKGLWIILDI